jgi:hypothetical protein
MVFAFPTMVIVFSTLVFDVEKMVLSLNHIFSLRKPSSAHLNPVSPLRRNPSETGTLPIY